MTKDDIEKRLALVDQEMEKRAMDLEEAIEDLWLGSVAEPVKEAALKALRDNWHDHNWKEAFEQ